MSRVLFWAIWGLVVGMGIGYCIGMAVCAHINGWDRNKSK